MRLIDASVRCVVESLRARYRSHGIIVLAIADDTYIGLPPEHMNSAVEFYEQEMRKGKKLGAATSSRWKKMSTELPPGANRR